MSACFFLPAAVAQRAPITPGELRRQAQHLRMRADAFEAEAARQIAEAPKAWEEAEKARDRSTCSAATRYRPWARIDQAGLLWLTAGRRLVALTADSATIETASRGRLTYRRVPNDPGRVLVWFLCDRGDR
jgi:hypothetical protein